MENLTFYCWVQATTQTSTSALRQMYAAGQPKSTLSWCILRHCQNDESKD